MECVAHFLEDYNPFGTAKLDFELLCIQVFIAVMQGVMW